MASKRRSPIPVLCLNPIFLESSIWSSIKAGPFDECMSEIDIVSYAMGVNVYLDFVSIHPCLIRTLTRYDLKCSFITTKNCDTPSQLYNFRCH